MEQISVLIVDDHAVVREGLRAFLDSEEDIEIVGEAAHGGEALEAAEVRKPDIVLLDLVMPQMDGISAIREIRKVSPGSKILILTSFGEDEKIFPAIEAGAMGFIMKDTLAEDLGLAIRCVSRGKMLLDAGVAERFMSASRPREFLRSEIRDLTPRELDVLSLIAKSQTNYEIANELGISVKTVKTHVSHILDKLGASDRTEAAVVAVKRNLVRRE